MRFWDFVKSRKDADNLRGDFIRDARMDSKTALHNPQSLENVQGYLALRGACQEAIQQAGMLWKEYQKYKNS